MQYKIYIYIIYIYNIWLYILNSLVYSLANSLVFVKSQIFTVG